MFLFSYWRLFLPVITVYVWFRFTLVDVTVVTVLDKLSCGAIQFLLVDIPRTPSFSESSTVAVSTRRSALDLMCRRRVPWWLERLADRLFTDFRCSVVRFFLRFFGLLFFLFITTFLATPFGIGAVPPVSWKVDKISLFSVA